MSESEPVLSPDELWQEVIALRQEVARLRSQEAELELLQDVTTQVSDDILADLEQKNQLIRKIFGRYLTEEVVSTLMASPDALQLGGTRRTVTVLVADLRGFTTLSERLAAEDVIKILNFFLGRMTEVITQYEGTINDFTGDGLMVLFGAPRLRPDDAQRAVTCAIAMQLAMDDINQQLQEWQLPSIRMGIGINTGEAVVGNIGSETHAKYSAIGKQVNLAYRIESYTVGGQVLIAEQTLDCVKTMVTVDEQIQLVPKGLRQPITVFSLKGIKLEGDRSLVLPYQAQFLQPLPQPLAVQCSVLEGKSVSPSSWQGHLTGLSADGAELLLADPKKAALVPIMTDIKINLLDRAIESTPAEPTPVEPDPARSHSGDIYAKVLHRHESRHTLFIYFTIIDAVDAQRLKTLYDALLAS